MQAISLKLKLLKPNRAKEQKMSDMVGAYAKACSWFAAKAEELNTINRAKLNRETYRPACELFALNRGTLQCAMLKALTARRSYLSHQAHGKKASPPVFDKPVPVMVRQDCYSLHQMPSGRWVLKLPVSSGRSQIAVPVAASPYHNQKLQDLAGGSCRQGSMEVWKAKVGDWYATITLVYETGINEPCGIIGVDLGVVKHAVLSTNTFFDGRQARWRKERWAERRKALQKHGRLSRVKREKGHEQRWIRDLNHKLSRQIVNIAAGTGKAIALENLLGIRERAKGSKKFNRMLSGWSFKELASFIEYKAALAGVPVIYVNPKGTSKTCPGCGNVSRYNRICQGWFKCTMCGYQSDADRVGAMSIAAKALNARGA